MKKHRLNFVSILLAVTLCSGALVSDDEVTREPSAVQSPLSFGISGPTLTQDVDRQVYAGELKYQAVLEWLHRELGPDADAFEKKLTKDIAEGFVLDYSISRIPGPQIQYQLSGHLDVKALRSWVNLSETREGSTYLRPLLLVSSALPNLSFSASETAARSKDTAVGQILLSETIAVFQKLNTKPIVPNASVPNLSAPPKREQDFKPVRDCATANNANSVLWFHLSACKSCGGTKLETFFYNPSQARLVLARSDDLPLAPTDFSSVQKMKPLIHPAMQQFKAELEDVVSEGTFFSVVVRIVVEGIPSYRVLKGVQSGLSALKPVGQLVVKRMEPEVAEFEVLTSRGASELSQLLDSSAFTGFRLKSLRVDSNQIVVRYLK